MGHTPVSLPRLLSVLVVLTLIACPTCAGDWANTAAQVDRSIVRVTHPESEVDSKGNVIKFVGICTGFSIAERDGYFLTDYHCLNAGTAADLLVDGSQARLLYKNKYLDLAVVTANLHKPALRPSQRPLRKGEQIATLGHGYGIDDTLFRGGYVALPSFDKREFNMVGHWLVFDTPYIGGMSGGPVFGLDGKVVGIVQQADELSGFGLGIQTILDATDYYWKG